MLDMYCQFKRGTQDYCNHLNASENSESNLRYSRSYGRDGSPQVLISGAIHGNEPAGVEAIVLYHEHLKGQRIKLQGKVTFVLGNPEAYQQDSRYVESDLNRAFTEFISLQTSEDRRAQELRSFFCREKEHLKAVLDLHSVSKGNFKMAAYCAENPRNIELAKAISPLPLHFMYHPEHLLGTFTDEASRHGLEALAIECGNHNAPDTVRVALQHINYFLVHYGLLRAGDAFPLSPSTSEEAIRTYETIDAIRPGKEFRFLDQNIVSECFLKEGQAFAHDQDKGTHYAPRNCYVMMPSKTSKPTDSDAGFLCVRR